MTATWDGHLIHPEGPSDLKKAFRNLDVKSRTQLARRLAAH
jgi:hypothetical protein